MDSDQELQKKIASEIGSKQPDDSVVTGAMHLKGGKSHIYGNSPTKSGLSTDSLFNEGSVTKVRLAGLAYILQQSGEVDTQAHIADIFAEEGFKQLLQERYGEKAEDLGKFINNLFASESKNATLADLLTHQSGVGDLTRKQSEYFKKEGIEKQYNLADLFLVNGTEKPRAQDAPHVKDEDLPLGQYGKHQYSNLGYMLAGLAIEYKAGKPLSNLYEEYLLHPTEGRAQGKEVQFDETHPLGSSLPNNMMKIPYYDPATEKVIQAERFNGCNAAGGTKTSANDLTKFMDEFFKGFPGTKEYQTDQNIFFTDDTIDQMWQEGKKHKVAGTNPDKRTVEYQLPGASVTFKVPDGIDIPVPKNRDEFNPTPEQLEVIFSPDNVECYKKNGGIYGCGTMITYDAESQETDLTVFVREGVSPQINKLVEESVLLAERGNQQEVQDILSNAKDLAINIGVATENFDKTFLGEKSDLLSLKEAGAESEQESEKTGPSWTDIHPSKVNNDESHADQALQRRNANNGHDGR